MTENQQVWNKRNENADALPTGQPYASTTSTRSTSTDAGLATEVNQPTISHQLNDSSASVSNSSASASVGTGMNPALTRALIGGLVGATLGTLAGALAGKRTAEGVNHAVKGVGEALRTVAGGVNQAAKGLGDAVKSVGEGVSHAVVGSASDVVQGSAETLKPVVVAASDAVKDIAENAKQSAVGVTDAVKNTAENASQTTVGTLDAVQSVAEGIKQSEQQSFQGYEDRSVVGTKQSTTGEFSNTGYLEPQTTDISAPIERERLLIDPNMDVDAGTENFNEGQAAGMESYKETTDSEANFNL